MEVAAEPVVVRWSLLFLSPILTNTVKTRGPMRTTQILLLLSVAADLGTVLGSDHNEILAKERSALKVSCPSSSLKRIGGLQRGAALTHAGLVLLAQRKIEHAAACVTQAIDTANEPQAWTVLGEIVRSRGQDAGSVHF